jgi:2-enoate reductase
MNVTLRLGMLATLEEILEPEPNVVIVATGAVQAPLSIPGGERKNVAAAVETLRGLKQTGEEVVIVGGGSIGCETAEFLVQDGKRVTILEMLEKAAADAPYLHWLGLMKELEKSVRLETRVKCIRITEKGVLAINEKGEEMPDDPNIWIIEGLDRSGYL